MKSEAKLTFIDRNQDHYYRHVSCEKYPFSDKKNIDFLCKIYGLSLLKIDLICNEQVDWEGIFFYKKGGKGIHIFSGGRFGYGGFFPIQNLLPISSYIDTIEEQLLSLDIATCSLAGFFLANNANEKSSSTWIQTDICYLVAKTDDCVNSEGLCFHKARTRSNLSRNLKKAKEANYFCKLAESEKEIKAWYTNCHIARIDELDGCKWDYEIIEGLIERGTGKLVIAVNEQEEILGGCIMLISDQILELFMMSTPLEYLKLGINYVITEWLYLFAARNDINYINWQASNPPIGPLVEFKKSWNAQEMNFPIYSKSWKTDITSEYLKSEFQDCFVFPYDSL